jgi:hypothetical protein
MTRDGESCGRTLMRGGMNNDPSVYHVSFLLNVGDNDGGGRWKGISEEIGERPGSTVDSQAKREEKGRRGEEMHAMNGVGDRGGSWVWSGGCHKR